MQAKPAAKSTTSKQAAVANSTKKIGTKAKPSSNVPSKKPNLVIKTIPVAKKSNAAPTKPISLDNQQPALANDQQISNTSVQPLLVNTSIKIRFPSGTTRIQAFKSQDTLATVFSKISNKLAIAKHEQQPQLYKLIIHDAQMQHKEFLHAQWSMVTLQSLSLVPNGVIFVERIKK